MTGLQVRLEAAVGLVRRGQLSPETALHMTVWPPDELEDAHLPQRRRKEWPQEIREEALALSEDGWSKQVIGEILGVSMCTVKGWIRQPGRTGADRRKFDRSLIS